MEVGGKTFLSAMPPDVREWLGHSVRCNIKAQEAMPPSGGVAARDRLGEVTERHSRFRTSRGETQVRI